MTVKPRVGLLCVSIRECVKKINLTAEIEKDRPFVTFLSKAVSPNNKKNLYKYKF